jgi:hypothetical protein
VTTKPLSSPIKQTQKEFSGRGQLLCDSLPPVSVRYYIVLSARPVLVQGAGTYETVKPQWEWDEAHGFVTLSDDAETSTLDLRGKCTLLLDDGTLCAPMLFPDYSRPRMKYRVQCAARELVGASAANPYAMPPSYPLYDAGWPSRTRLQAAQAA